MLLSRYRTPVFRYNGEVMIVAWTTVTPSGDLPKCVILAIVEGIMPVKALS